MKAIIVLALFDFFNKGDSISNSFKQLICDYDQQSLNISLSKKDLQQGFKHIHKIECFHEINPKSFWFSIIREGKQIELKIFKLEEAKKIPDFLKILKVGDTISFTILCMQDFMQRRDKMINISSSEKNY